MSIKGLKLLCLWFIMLPIIGFAFSNDLNKQLTETPSESIIQLVSKTDSLCYNQSTGFIQIEIADSISNYDILWSNGSTGLLAENLESGLHSVSITDLNGLTDVQEYTIHSFPHSSYQLINDITSCESLTSIEILHPESMIDIQDIFWSTNDNSMKLEDIEHGAYSANITDMYGCMTTVDINTSYLDTIPPQLVLKDLSMDLGIDGKLPILFPENFIELKEDNCSNEVDIFPEQVVLDCSNVGLNTIHVLAIDQMGNIKVDSFTVEVKDVHAPLIFCPANQVINHCDSVFFGQPYSFDNCNELETRLISGLESGSVFPQGKNTLVFEASDASGNTAQCQTTIQVDYGIDYQISSFESSCADSDDGAIIIQASGLHGEVDYVIENHQGNLYDMPAGLYPITFTDSLGCSVTDTAIITSPSPMLLTRINMIHPDEFDGNNGWIQIEVQGGTAPYRFTWYKGSEIVSQDQNPINLEAGNYTVQIKDSYQCAFESEALELGMTTATSEQDLENTIHLYPNPASRLLRIEFTSNDRVELIECFSTNGQKVFKSIPSSETIEFDVSNFESGMYIMRFKTGNGYIYKKLIITS